VPRLDRAAHTPLPVIGGRPPDLSSRLAGCPFAPRCPRAADRCARERPELAEDEPGHSYACWYPLAGAGQAGAGQAASASASGEAR
jgi:oligopeptide/dipeptide ABC transporter ATP-binding protein